MDFVWINGQWRYTSKETYPADLKIVDSSGSLVAIKCMEPHEAVKVVGVHQALDGNMDKQIEVLSDKIDELGNKIRDNWVPRRLAWQGFKTMVWQSLKYPLAACSMTKAQGKKLTTQLYKFFLPKLGVNRCFPLAYRHSPKCYQGLSLPEVYESQEMQKIDRLLANGDTKCLTGDILGASLEQLQLEVGIGSPVIEAPYDVYGHLATYGWWQNLWEFVSTEKITLRQEAPFIPPLQREDDYYVMERLIQRCNWSDVDIRKFNRCRIKMQVVTLADLIHGDGISLRENMKTYSPEAAGDSKYDWAREEPARSDWTIWRKGLKTYHFRE